MRGDPTETGRRVLTDRPLRIGFDGRALTSPAAGVRRYTSELLSAIVQRDAGLELVMLGGSAAAAPEGIGWVPEPPHPPTNAGWVLVGLPLAMRRAGVDLLHAPAYTAPFLAPAPVVLTIHDVSYARQPAWFPYHRDRLRRAFYRWSALSARLVITDSEFSASEIHAAYGIGPDRIVVIPLGVDGTFQSPSGGRAVLPAGVRRPFVLHVGDLHERRNLGLVVEAVIAARQQVPALSGLSLVMAGVDRGVGKALQDSASVAGAGDAVVVMGSIDEGTLRTLYGQAVALVYPSLYEGFGLPLLEAMASGLPVLASRAASIPEVVGDAGVVLDPHSSDAWCQAIVRVATDLELAARLRAAGLARAAAFSWDHTAGKTIEVYRRALAAVTPGPA